MTFLPLSAGELIQEGQRVASSAKLEYYGPDTAFCVLLALIRNMGVADGQKLRVKLDTQNLDPGTARSVLGQFKDLKDFVEIEVEAQQQQTLVLQAGGVLLDQKFFSLERQSVPTLFRGLLSNLRLFQIQNTQTAFPGVFQDFQKAFWARARTDLGEPFVFCTVDTNFKNNLETSSSSQGDEQNVDDILAELCCDFELCGDRAELLFDFPLFAEDYQALLAQQVVPALSRDAELRIGGELLCGPLEQFLLQSLAEAGVSRVGAL